MMSSGVISYRIVLKLLGFFARFSLPTTADAACWEALEFSIAFNIKSFLAASAGYYLPL